MERRVDVAVVGAGIMGLATARALGRAGRRAACFEQFRVGHVRGSSHGTSRIFRLAYADPEYTRLAQEALPLWRELEAESGNRLLETTGSLDVGGPLEDIRAALDGSGVAAEVLEMEDLRRRFPSLRLPDEEALFHAEGGVLHADRAVGAFAASARAHGAEIIEETRVLELVPAEASVRLETAGGSVVARAAVVTAGPWVGGLVGDVPVSVTRETVVHFRVAQNGLPTVIDHSPPEVPVASTNQAAYALPSPGIGLKAGVHRSGEPTDPDRPGDPDEAVVEVIAAWARDRYPLAEPSPALVETCLYTNTQDQRFVLERRGPLVICSACSGHGFKFAPVLGRRITDLVELALAE